jgi:tetratricopeptide (TPR) repeat protein
MSNLGKAYISLGQYEKAIEYQKRSLAIFEEIGNKQGVAANLGNLPTSASPTATLGRMRRPSSTRSARSP